MGVWFFNEDQTELQCISQYHIDNYQELITLNTSQTPTYVKSIIKNKILRADDVLTSKETKELTDYFKSYNIMSLLDSAITDGAKVIGVICMECVTRPREWQQDEIILSSVLGRIMGATFTHNKRVEAEEELRAVENHLTETNITLTNVLKKFEEEKKAQSENIALNIERNINPIIEQLKKSRNIDQDLIKQLELGIADLSSGFYKKLVKVNYNLTPTEVKVCQLIKSGYQGKEIAEMMNLSFSTIETHKKNIRRKLDITGKAINLRVYLNEIENY